MAGGGGREWYSDVGVCVCFVACLRLIATSEYIESTRGRSNNAQVTIYGKHKPLFTGAQRG